MDRIVGPETERLIEGYRRRGVKRQMLPGFAAAEVRAMGWSRQDLVALRRIRKMGRLVSGRKYVENIAGQNQPLPAYRIRKDDAE